MGGRAQGISPPRNSLANFAGQGPLYSRGLGPFCKYAMCMSASAAASGQGHCPWAHLRTHTSSLRCGIAMPKSCAGLDDKRGRSQPVQGQPALQPAAVFVRVLHGHLPRVLSSELSLCSASPQPWRLIVWWCISQVRCDAQQVQDKRRTSTLLQLMHQDADLWTPRCCTTSGMMGHQTCLQTLLLAPCPQASAPASALSAKAWQLLTGDAEPLQCCMMLGA